MKIRISDGTFSVHGSISRTSKNFNKETGFLSVYPCVCVYNYFTLGYVTETCKEIFV
jgi:hypothetical protein